MDFELQTGLLIIGVVFIAAILIHGIIGIRKANSPIDISELDLKETDGNGDILRDGSGFDRHGVGVAKRIPVDEESAEDQPFGTENDVDGADPQSRGEVQLDLGLETPIGHSDNAQSQSAINFDVALNNESTVSTNISTSVNIEPQDDNMTLELDIPVFASPIVQEKEDFLAAKRSSKQSSVTDESEQGSSVKVNAATTAENASKSEDPLDVLVLNVVAGDDSDIDGATLLPTLLTLGFKFGEMNIFHRHVKATGQGDVLFSLVNMVTPGTFDVENMEQFTTTGVSLFMTLPHAHGNMETFNTMLNAAAKIAEQFNGQVLDGGRSTLTKQSTQHYVQRIREVERKLLLNK